MESYLLLYSLINLFCIILVLVFAFHSRMGMGAMVAQRRFMASMFGIAVFLASDTLWYAMDCGFLPQVWIASMILKSIYFLSATVTGYLWCLYMASLTKARFLHSTKRILLLSGLVWIHLALLIFNFFNPILFGVDESFTYFRGPAFSIQYVFVYVYLVAASLHALYKAMQPENYIDRSRYIIISLFPVLPAISGILQLFYWRVPFNCLAFTLAVVIVYLTELSEQISQEPLTHLSNRKQFMRALEQSIESRGSEGYLCLFMTDIDDFKPVNDTFGHLEGDRALLLCSEALKKAVREMRQRVTLARYGGDEFAIIATFDSPDEADKLVKHIEEELEAASEQIGKDYRLELSIGYAFYQPPQSMRDFIAAADKSLYEVKKERKSAIPSF